MMNPYTHANVTLPPQPRLIPQAVRTSKALLMKSEAVFRGKLQYKQAVWLPFGNLCKVISIRQEHCDDKGYEHVEVFCYRANVWDTKAKVMRFVNLKPGQLLEVR